MKSFVPQIFIESLLSLHTIQDTMEKRHIWYLNTASKSSISIGAQDIYMGKVKEQFEDFTI
jgi:hypothetical protein